MEERRKVPVMNIFRAAWGALVYQFLAIIDILTNGVLRSYLIKGTQNSLGAIISILIVSILPLACLLSIFLGVVLIRRKADRVLIALLFSAPLLVLVVWLIF